MMRILLCSARTLVRLLRSARQVNQENQLGDEGISEVGKLVPG